MKWLSHLFVLCMAVLVQTDAVAAATSTLTENRILLFDDYFSTNAPTPIWVHTGPAPTGTSSKKAILPGTNHFHRTGWRLLYCRTGSANWLGQSVPPAIYAGNITNQCANLQNTTNAVIESPVLTNGVGTVYFEAINNLSTANGQITLEYATNMVASSNPSQWYPLNPPSTNGLQYVWQTLEDIPLSATAVTNFTRCQKLLNYRLPAKLRIRRTLNSTDKSSLDDAFIVVANIRVSPPPADVVVYNTEALNQSGSRIIRCFVSHASASEPATSRTVTATFRWFNTGPMSNVVQTLVLPRVDAGDGDGSGERYEATMPEEVLGGDLEYSVECTFEGAWYQSPDYTELGYAGYPSEARPSFKTPVLTKHFAGLSMVALTVNGGSGGGVSYTNGQQVAVTAGALTGKAFAQWTGDTQYVASVTSPSTTVTMPDFDISITATYTNRYYALTVNSGTGGGAHAYGQAVTITADPPPTNTIFSRWTGDTASVASVTSATTTVTMPASDVVLTATYVNVYTLEVASGSGDGSYTNGRLVTITADPPSANMIFEKWTGAVASVANVTSETTTVMMPPSNIVVTANYVNVYTLDVTGGNGDGTYTSGRVVTITAEAPPANMIFEKWTGDTASVANILSATTTVTMPSSDVALTATYINVYTLTVSGGSGSGSSYTNHQPVAIVANAPAIGKAFDRWTGDTQHVANAASATTAVTMPSSNITVTATYVDILYSLTVNSGSGTGTYTNGHQLAITASVPADKTFSRWIGDTQCVANVTNATTTVTMPPSNIVLTATYSSLMTALTDTRFLHFNDYFSTNGASPVWVHEGPAPTGLASKKAILPGTNHFHSAGWRLVYCRTGSANWLGQSIPPAIYSGNLTNQCANFQNTLKAQIESPVWQEGIGTIYFEAINSLSGVFGQITVEYATNMVSVTDSNAFFPMNTETNDKEYVWQKVEDLPLNAVGVANFTRYQKRVNFRQPAKIRISRTAISADKSSLDDAFIVLDNIRVSPPPSDVVVTKAECPFEPGYPAVNDSIRIRCYVDNADLDAPTDTRSVTLFYRWRYLNQASNAWASVTMTRADEGDGNGNRERFEGLLPKQTQVGDLEYYFTCSFEGKYYRSQDYTGLNYPYAGENLPPFTLRGGASEPDGREFYSRLRPFKSRYGAMYVMANTNKFLQPIAMDLVADDEWRGMVPVRSVAVTNLDFYFMGINAYESGSDTYLKDTNRWTEQAQVGVGRLPYGGRCVETASPVSIKVTGASGGYMQAVFNSSTLEYMTCRTEYQNFNAWPAQESFFSDSSGQDPRKREFNSFDSWPVNSDNTVIEYFRGYPSGAQTTNLFVRDPFGTFNGWLAGRSAYVVDRLVATGLNLFTPGVRNVGLRLKGGDSALGLGYIYNDAHSQYAKPTDGLKEFSFKCRLAQAGSNYDVAYNQTEFLKTNYAVSATLKISPQLSPAQPSVSLIGYYQNPGKFYEFRVTQIDGLESAAPTLNCQLFKWLDGVATQLGATAKLTGSGVPKMTDATAIEMCLFNSATSTVIRCNYAIAYTNVVVVNDTAPIKYGTYGFLTADCRASFSAVATRETIADAVPSGSQTIVLSGTDLTMFESQKGNWYTPPNRFAAVNTISPYGIYSVVPSQKVGVYLQPTDFGSTVNPSGPGDSLWQKVYEVNVPDFGYTTVTVPVNTWKSQFTMLQLMGGAADVVVDELVVSSWHGQQSGSGDDYDWLATEAWVVSNSVAESHVVQLDHTRGNPDPEIAQAVRSPMLDTGMGMMEFDYRVLRAPAKLTVQYALKSNPTVWFPVKTFESSSTTTWVHATSYLGNTAKGFLRVANVREGAYTNALVEINNAVVWDEPYVGATSWKVYNAKVTDEDKMRVALDESTACFLNNDQKLETDPGPVMDLDVPYVQSSTLQAGLGELKFNARAYSNNSPATVYIFASTNGWAATSNQWFEIGRVENISNMLYQSYQFSTLIGKKYDAVRLTTQATAGAKRVCLEEVAASEPVFPGFDIVNVKALCREQSDDVYSTKRFQPVASDAVGVEAQLSNIQLSPSNIEMYVTYYIGTNVWGVNRWPAGQTVTKPMFPIASNSVFYRTSPTNDLPRQALDQIVQYRVWARYDGGIKLLREQDTFDLPSWYYPQDLNKTYVAQGWSPYYIVYGAPLGSVWINEINSTDYVISNGVQQLSIGDNPYIEIAVPAGVDLAGWKVDLVGDGYVARTITIPNNLPAQVAASNGNGYAFFVIGEHPSYRPKNVPALPKLDYGYQGLSDAIPKLIPGGLRLRRPMGMYEQAVAYDWNAANGSAFSGTNWAAKDPQQKFVYVGREHNGGSLGVTGTTTTNWYFPQVWTPGWPNSNQTVPDADTIMPGATKAVITSVMSSDKATQNGVSTSPYTLRLLLGDGTNIEYVAKNWYRIMSVKVNQQERLGLGGPYSNAYTLVIENIQTNLDVYVTIGLRPDISSMGLSAPVLNWLLGYGDKELVTSHYKGQPLSLSELYWLNANPTATNHLEFSVTQFSIDSSSNVSATVKMALNSQNVTNLQGNSVMKLQVKKGLADPQWSLLSQYAFGLQSFDTNHTSRIVITNPFLTVLPGWNPLNIFCQGNIEMEDPRVIVHELISK